MRRRLLLLWRRGVVNDNDLLGQAIFVELAPIGLLPPPPGRARRHGTAARGRIIGRQIGGRRGGGGFRRRRERMGLCRHRGRRVGGVGVIVGYTSRASGRRGLRVSTVGLVGNLMMGISIMRWMGCGSCRRGRHDGMDTRTGVGCRLVARVAR